MTDELVLYYNPMSRARMVHWMLEEVGVPYRMELVSLERGEHKQPRFLAVNPMGKLPTLTHRGVVISETAAIITYLADAFPAAGLAPALDAPQRGSYLRWMFFGAGCVEPALIDRMLARPAAAKSMAMGYGTFDDTFNVLESALKPGPYILGGCFSAADVYLGSQIGFGIMTKSLEPRPQFQAYLERLHARAAHQRFMQQSEGYATQLKASA